MRLLILSYIGGSLTRILVDVLLCDAVISSSPSRRCAFCIGIFLLRIGVSVNFSVLPSA